MQTNYNRRDFLGRAVGVGGAVIAAGRATPAFAAISASSEVVAAPTQPSVAGIGVQLYSVGDQIRVDVDRTLEAVAKIGYKVVEFAGYGTEKPEQIRATMDRLKMTSPSTHIGLPALRTDFDGQVHIAQTLGHKYITIPSLGQDNPANTVDGWKRVADEFNSMGAKLKAKGIGLGFHSHSGEYADVGGGKKGMDVFISNTDPSLVTFEMDLGWARVASQDPVEWFRRYPGRFKMWHVKDMLDLPKMQATQLEAFRNPPPPRQAPPPAPAGGQGAAGGQGGPGAGGQGGAGGQAARPAPAVTSGPVPVGAGNIDYKPIFAQWKLAGVEYFFVEQDGANNWPGGSLSAIATSYRNLVNLLT
jgi:sugar phosphate isomerase/epimerase